ncbi:microtubule-associated protein futsch isoform X2 [Dermacentor albipictus]|uniref:microtubule-associated protein futsch isoform X2 n=1 Tax=Dermacentor albipictus TaxID=60249 RepID=UPI0031FC8F0C
MEQLRASRSVHKEAPRQTVLEHDRKFSGLLSWDVKATGTDLASAEKACLSVKVSAGPHNELLIQHSTESLALEVLLNPEVSTLRQCFKNMMVSGTTHKHVIHAGYAFAGSGDWILQDGVFSARDVEALLHDADVQEVLRRQKFHTLHVHCSAEGSWAQPPVGVSLNPPDIADSLAGSVHLLGCLDAVLTSPPLTSLLPSSSVVGNIRFRRPTMYVFPGGQGDCALFGVTGFTLLVDGGFARKPCFWEFVRHLDRLDSLLVTRFNQFNSCGLTALAQRKALERVYPQVGHVFCNAVRSPSDEELQKDRDQLVVSVVAQGLEFLQGVREMGLSPQACQRDARPLTLYHKVGHGTLEMFVLSPGRSTEEDASVCALLVWRPAKVSEPVTRILLPGSASQNVIFEGLSKLGHLAVLKSRAVTAEARLGLKKSKVQDKPLRATSVPPRPSVAKRAAAKVESPSPSPTPPPAEKVRAPVKQTNKSIESLPKKQDEVKKPSKTGAKREPKKSAVEKADAKDEKAPKITAKVPAKVAETIPAKEKIVEKLGENELDNVEEKDISKIISDKPLKKLPLEIEKIDTKAQEEIVAKVEEKVAAKRELKKATPTRPPAKSKGAKDVTNKMAVESKTTARKTADPAKVKPRPLVAPPTRPMVRDSKSKSPSSSASSSPKRTPPKPTTERPVRSVRGGVRNAKAPAAEPVKLPEGEKPVLIEKPTAQVKPDKRIEVLTQSGDESSGSKEAIEEKAATEATKEDKPFIEPSSSDESKKDIPKQKSPVTVDEAPIKAVLLGTAHAMPTTDFQAVPTKPLEKDIADAETWPAEGDAKEVAETPEHALSPEPTVSASSEGVPSLIDEVIDVSLKADSSVARQITEPELSRVRALSSGQRTPDSLDTPHEVGDGTAPSSRDEILEAMEKHQLVSREQVLEIKRRDSVDSIEGEIPMEDEEIVHPPQEADKKTAGVPISAHVGQEFPEPDDHAELKQKFQQPTQRAADLPSHDIEHATDEPSKRSPEEPCAEPAMVEKPEGVVLDTAKEEPSAVGMLDTADEKICDAEIIAKAESQIETSAPEISVSAAKDIAQKEPPEFKGTTEAEPMTKQLKEDSVLSTVRETSDNKPSEPSGIEPEKPTDDTKQADLHEITEKPSEPSVIEMVEQVIESPAQKTPESKVSEDAEEKPAKPDATDKIKLEFERTKQEILASEVPEVLKTKPAGPESIQKLEPAIQKPTEETTKAAVFEVAEKLLGESEIMQKVEQDIERLADESRVSSVPEVREKSAEPDGIEKTEPKFERQAEKTPVSAVPEFAEKKPAKPEGVQKAEPGIDIPDEETTISAVPDVAAKKPAEPEGVQQMEPEIERPAEGSPLRAVPDVAEKLAEPDSVEKVEPDIGVTGQDTFASVVPVFLEKQPAEPEVIQMVEPGIEKLAEDTPLSAVPDVTEKKAVESEGFQKGEPAIQRPTEETPARSVAEAVEKPTEPESIEKMKPEIKSPAEEAPVSTVPEATEKKPAEPESFIKVEPEPERPSDDTSGATVHEVEEKKPAEPESIDQEKQEIERPPQETPLSGEPELAEKAAESEGDVKVEPEIGRLAEEPSMSAMPEVAEDKPTEPEGADKIEPVTERLAEETPVRTVSQVPKKPAEPVGFQMVETELVQPDVETPFEPDGVQKVEPVTERPAEKTPEIAVLEVAKKKPSEADGVQEIEPEIGISAEEASVSKVLDTTEKKPVERDGVEQVEPLPERQAEETHVSTDFEVADIKPAETGDLHEVESEIERLPDETAISGVFEVMEKEPVETDGVIKVEQEFEKLSQETPTSAVPEVVEKKPPEPDSAGKVEADIERPADKTSVGAVPGVAERKLAIHEGLQEAEPEIEKPAEKTPMSALQEVTEKTPMEPDDARKVEPKIERHDEETPVSPVPGEADKKPTDRQSPIKAEPEIQRPVEETPGSALPAVQVKQPSELEDLQKDEPEIERPTEETPVSVELAVAERTPAEPEGLQDVEPYIEKPAEKSPTSVVPEFAEKKLTEHDDAQKDKPEIERLAEETAAIAVPGVAEKKPAEPEGVQEIEPKIEKPAQETPVSPVPEMVDKKPTERESAIKMEPEIEGPAEESPVSAVPGFAEKQPAEPEGLQKAEPDFERPAEETPVSFVPEAVEKEPIRPETFRKIEPEFERPAQETPLGVAPAVEERTPAEPEGLQEVELEIEKFAEKSPMSAVPEVAEKKPTEQDYDQKGKPDFERLAEKTAASAMPEVTEKAPTETEGFTKVESKIGRPTEETPMTAVPEVARKKPTEPNEVHEVEPKIERSAEEALPSPVPEPADKKPAERESVVKVEWEIEGPPEESRVSAVPEVAEKESAEPEGVQKVESKIDKRADESPVSPVPEGVDKKPMEPEIEGQAEESPVSAVPEVTEKQPVEPEALLKVKPEIERHADETPVSFVPDTVAKKPSEPESVGKVDRGTERPAEETSVSGLPAVAEGTPAEPDGSQEAEPEIEKLVEKSPTSAVPEVGEEKPTEHDDAQKGKPEFEGLAEETAASAMPEVAEKKPAEPDDVQKLEPKIEKPDDEAPVSPVPKAADKKPAERERVVKVEPEIEEPAEESPVSAVPVVAEKQPAEPEGLHEVEPDFEKIAEETPVSSIPEALEKKPTEPETAEKVEPEVERPAEDTPVSGVPTLAERTPAQPDGLQEVEPEIEKPAEKAPMRVVPEVAEKKPTEHDHAQKGKAEIERLAEETAVSVMPEVAEKKPAEPEGLQEVEPDFEKPAEETPVSSIPEALEKKPTEPETAEKVEPEVERPVEDTPVSGVPAVAERIPAQPEGLQEVEPEIEKPAEKSPTSVVPEVAEKKPTEHDHAQKGKAEIERLAEETAVSVMPEVAEKKPAEPEGVHEIEPKIGKQAEATPVSPVPEVVDKKPTERESAIKVEPEIEGPLEESPVSAVPEVPEKQAAEPRGLQKVEPEIERPADETPVSSVPEAVEKKPTEPETAGKVEPEIERPAEETPVSAVPAIAEITLAEPEGLQEVELVHKKSAEKSPTSAVPEVAEKKPTEHDHAQKDKPEIERLAEETAASAVPGVAEKKPAEPEGVERIEMKIEEPAEEAPVRPVPEVVDKKATEPESAIKVEPEIEGPAEESRGSEVLEVAEKQPAELEGLQKHKPEIGRPAEKTPVSSVPEAVEKKPTEPEAAGKVQPEIERPAEETTVGVVLAVAEKTPTEPEGLQEVEPDIEKPAEKSPTSVVPEVAEKKPTERDHAQKDKPEIARLAEETAASAVPGVAEKKPAEPESVEKIETKIEEPAEETPVSPVPEVVGKKPTEPDEIHEVEPKIERSGETLISPVPEAEDKKPAERESIVKVEPEIEGPAEESSVSAVPDVAGKQPAVPEGLQKVFPEIERPAEETPVSSVLEALEKKPTEPETAGKVEPEIERAAQETPVSGVPVVAERTPAEPEGLQEVEQEIEKSADKSPMSAVPEVAEKKPAERDGAEKGKLEIEVVVEETAASAVPEVAEKKAAEPEDVEKVEPKIEKSAEETPVTPVAEVVDKKLMERESAIKVEPEIEGPAEESPVSEVPKVAVKQPAELEGLQKHEPEIERPAEKTPVSVEPAVAEKAPAEPEGLQEFEPEAEKPAEETLMRAAPQGAEKPSERDYVQKGKAEIERLAEETAVSVMPEVTEKIPAEPEGVQKVEPKIEGSAEEAAVSTVPEVVDKKPTERGSAIKVVPEIEGPAEESPVCAGLDVAEKQPAERVDLQKVEAEIEGPAEETPGSSVSKAVEKKPSEPESAGKVEPGIGRPAEETPFNLEPAVGEKTTAEPEGWREVQPEIEKPAEKTPMRATTEVAQTKPTDRDDAQKGKLEIETPVEETVSSAVPEVTDKKPAEHEGVHKGEPEFEVPAEEASISPHTDVADEKPTVPESVEKVEPERAAFVTAVPEVAAEKEPGEPDSVDTIGPEIERPTEETFVVAPELAGKKPAEAEALKKAEREIDRPVEETPANAIPEVAEKKSAEPDSIGKEKPEIEGPPQETTICAVPDVAEKKLTEAEGVGKAEPEIERRIDDISVRSMPEIAEKKPVEHEGVRKVEPLIERPADLTSVSAVPEFVEKKPTKPEEGKKGKPLIEKPAEGASVSAIPEDVEEKPTEPEIGEKMEPEIERPPAQTPLSIMPEAAEKKHAAPEGVRDVEPEMRSAVEEAPINAVPEFAEKKPTEPESVEKEKPDIEIPPGKLPVDAVPEVAEKKATEPESVAKGEREIERPFEEMPIGAVPEVVEKKPTENDGVGKGELEIEKPAEETSVSAMPEIAEKPAKSDGVQEAEPEIERLAQETPISAVPEVRHKIPTDPEVIEKSDPVFVIQADNAPVSVVTEVAQKKPAMSEGIRKVEPLIERATAETPVSAVPEDADQKPIKPEGFQNAEPGIDRPAEQTPGSAMTDGAGMKTAEPESVPKMGSDIERPAEVSPVSAVPEVAKERASDHKIDKQELKVERPAGEPPVRAGPESDYVQKLETGIARAVEETPLTAVPEVMDKKSAEVTVIKKAEPDIDEPALDISGSAVPKVVEKKPAYSEGVHMVESQMEDVAEKTPVRPEPEIYKQKLSDVASFADIYTAHPEDLEEKKHHLEKVPFPEEWAPASSVSIITPPSFEDIESLEKISDQKTPEHEEGEVHLEKPEERVPGSALKDIAERTLTKPEDIDIAKPCSEGPVLEPPVSTITDKKASELADLEDKEVRIDKFLDKSPISPVSEIVQKKAVEPEYIAKEEPPLGVLSGHDVTKPDDSVKDKPQIYKQGEQLQVSAVPELTDETPSQPEDIEKRALECEKPTEKAQLSTMPEVLDKMHIKLDKGAEQGHDLSSTVAIPGETEETRAGPTVLAFHKEVECPAKVVPEFAEQKALEIGDHRKPGMQASDSAMPETDELIASLKHQEPEKAVPTKAILDAGTSPTKAEETILQRTDADQKGKLSEQSSLDKEGIVTSPGEETADEGVYTSVRGDPEMHKGTVEVHEIEDFESRVDEAEVEGVVTSPLHSLTDDSQHFPVGCVDKKLDGVSITELHDGYQKEHARRSEEEPSGSVLGHIQPQDAVSGEHGLQELQVEVLVPDERKEVELAEKHEPSSSKAVDQVQKVDEEHEEHQQGDKEDLGEQASAPPQSFLFSDTSSSGDAFPELSDVHQSGYLSEEYDVPPSTAMIPEVDGTIAEDLIAAKEQAQKQLEDEGEDGVPSSFSRASSKEVQSTIEKNGVPPYVGRLPDFEECCECVPEQEYVQTEIFEKDDAPVVPELSDHTCKVSKETSQRYVQEHCKETDPLIPHDYDPSTPTGVDREILDSDGRKCVGRTEDVCSVHEAALHKTATLPSYSLAPEDGHELKTGADVLSIVEQEEVLPVPETLQTAARDSKLPEYKSLGHPLDCKPDISESTPSSGAKVDLPFDKVIEPQRLSKGDELSQKERETVAGISEGNLVDVRYKVPETKDIKQSSPVSQDSELCSREVAQTSPLISGEQADLLMALEEPILHGESDPMSESFMAPESSEDDRKIHATPSHLDEDHVYKGMPTDTDHTLPIAHALDESVSPQPCSTKGGEIDITKQELHLSLSPALGIATSVYSKAKELLEECVTATDTTSPGGAISTSSPKSSVSEDSFRSVVQKDDGRDVLITEERCPDRTCDEDVVSQSGVTTGYDFRSPSEVLRRGFLEETSHTLAKEWDKTMVLQSPSQDEEGRQLLEIIKSQLVRDESADFVVTSKEQDPPGAGKDIPPADSSKHLSSTSHAETSDAGLEKSPDSTRKRDEALAIILDQITEDDWDGATRTEPQKMQVSKDAAEVPSSLSEDSTTKFDSQEDVSLGSEDQREPSSSGHLLMKGPPEEEKSVPASREPATTEQKPASPSAQIEVFEEVTPETSLSQGSGSITRDLSETRDDGSALPDSNISKSSPVDESSVKLSEEKVHHFPLDLDASSATDLSSSPVALKKSAGHPDLRTMSDKEPESATEIASADLEMASEKSDVCDARLSSEPEGTKVRDEASYGEADEKQTATSGSPPLIRQEQDSYEPEAPWIHHRGSQDVPSLEISDQPMKDPRATCPTSLDAPELAHMQQRMSVEYESSITSVSDIEFAIDAKTFRSGVSEGSWQDDSKTAECSKGENDASRPSSPESPPKSPVKRIAAEHPRTSKRARTTSESKHPIATQGSSEADISSEDEDSAHKVIAHSFPDAPSYGAELPKESPQSAHSSQQAGLHPEKDKPLEGDEYCALPGGADYSGSRHPPLEVQPDSLPYFSDKTEGLYFAHKRTPSEEDYLPIAESPDEAKKNGKGSEAPQLASQHVADSSSSTKPSEHDVQVPPSLLEPEKAKISGETGSQLDETYSSQLKRSSIESETTSSSDDAGSGRRSLTGSKDTDLMREYTRHLETSPSARFSVDSTCSVTSEERSYTELEKPYQKDDSRESFSSTVRDHPDQSSVSGTLYSDSTIEPFSTLDHQMSIAPHISTEQVELGSSADALLPVKPERPTQVAKMEQQSDVFPTSTATSEEMESDVEAPLCEETVTREPGGHISSAAEIPMMEARQPVTVVAHGHGIASGLFAALKTELCVIDSPSMDTVLVQTGKDAQSLSDQGVFDTSLKFSQEHRELDSSEIKIPETEREAPTDQARSDNYKIGSALHTSGIMPDKESKETRSISGDDEALPGRKVSGEVTPVKALRFQLGDDSFIEPLADHTDTSAPCTSFDADHGLSKEVFETKVRLEKFLEAEFLETMATDEEEESSRASVKPSTTSITSSSHQENGHKVAEPKDDVTDDGVTLASGLSSGLPTELVCMAQSSVDLSKDITRITKCADSQERVSPPPTSPLDAAKQDEPAAVAAGLASGLPVELVCMVESRELCSEIKRAEEEAIHHVIEKKADYAEEDDGVAMQAYIERRLSDSDHFTDKQQRASPPSEIVSTSQHGMPIPERKPSKGFDELHLNGTSHSPPSVGLVAGLAAGLATELVCMPQSAEELCIDASESRWPPARGSRVEPIPPEMTASIYEELTEHTGEKPCSDTDTESVGQGAADSAVPHRMGQIPVQREVITTVTSRRVVYQHDGLPDTWDASTFSEPPQHDTEDDSRRTTVTYVYRTYTSGEGDDKGDPTLSSGTLPSSRGEDGLPFDILRSTAERHPREEDMPDEGDHVTGTSSRSYVYTVSSDHSAPEAFIRHADDTGTLHHPDSSIHSIAMDEVARITEMAAAAVSQSPNGWTVVHRSADSSSQRPLELTSPAELVERRNGHATHVTETRQIVYHPGSSAEFRFALGPSAEETCLPPEGSDPKTILEFMAAQTKQAAKEMLEEQPLYEEDEEAAQEQSSLSDASPLVEEPVFGKTLQPDYPELVELSAGNTPSEPPSPHSAAQDARVRHNGEPSGTSSVQRMVVVEETEPTSTMAGGSEARRVVSYVEEPTTVVREEWVLESGRGAASHVISQSSMFQHEVLTREESTSAGTASSPASTGGDAVRFTTLHHLERDLGAAAGAVQRSSLKASMAAVQHEQLGSDAEGASGTEAPRDTVRELQTTSAEGQANGRRDGDAAAPFDIRDWGKPLGLPVPPDPSSKSSKTGGKKAGAAAMPRDAADVVYVDLTYVPHHGDPGYCDAEFFSRVRARYYVLSGTNPSQQVLDALLEAKRGWGEPDAPVTVIPTYETDALCYWIAHNQKALEEHHIDVAPSASRCTINLQDHESSCAAYRLEF